MKVPKRIGNILINALQGGVVPRTGLGYIAVGRDQEITALLNDIATIEDGGASFRLVAGTYGSGKTFLLQTIKEHAMARGFVVADADLSPDRNLIGTSEKEKGLATYGELMSNLSTKTNPTGGALTIILDKWTSQAFMDAVQQLSTGSVNGADLEKLVEDRVNNMLYYLQELPHGMDFAKVLTVYWKASRTNDVAAKGYAIQWLRGGFRTKREAKKVLPVSEIIADNNWYDYIKLFSRFLSEIGFKGLIVIIDELINLYKSVSPISRQTNYEKILSIYNDTMQGKASHLGFILGATPQAIEDPSRGLFSYEALKSRLESSRYHNHELVNLMSPIIWIQPLTKAELIVLLEKIAEIHSSLYDYSCFVTAQDITSFVETAVSENIRITPRSIIRDFIDVLNLAYQNPNVSIRAITERFDYSSDNEKVEDIED